MTKQERNRLATIVEQANQLMDAPPTVNPTVTNADVTDALIADIGAVLCGVAPKSLAALIEIDAKS